MWAKLDERTPAMQFKRWMLQLLEGIQIQKYETIMDSEFQTD